LILCCRLPTFIYHAELIELPTRLQAKSLKSRDAVHPTTIGFKIFALGDSGYILNWEYTKPGLNKGALTGKKQISVKIPNSTTSTLLNPI
jgi:hypothetical protein